MHSSVKLDTPCEIVTMTSISPLISKCQIKVCYVGEEPNRNHSVITKEVALEMGRKLPGSPIVGYFNDAEGDFEEHNRMIDISNGKFEIKDTTKPYGFVAPDAKVWFAKFKDDYAVVREYLMTEGYLWTGQYPECQRILERGNNHSMELDEKTLSADWSFNDNGDPEFFIINEAIISKLCILGEKVEPCFEGSQITKVQFSFEDGFKQQLFSMMNELKNLLNGGEPQMNFTTYAVEIGDSLWTSLYKHVNENYSIERVCEEDGQKFAILKSRSDAKFYRLDFSVSEEEGFVPATEYSEIEFSADLEPQFSVEAVEAFETEFKKKSEEEDKSSSEDNSNSEDNSEDGEKSESEEDDDESDDDEEDKKKKYSLDEIPEYVELLDKYNALESSYNEIVAERDSLKNDNESLVKFKKVTERSQKEAMINDQFYMLSDEDKADVVANIDNYSLDDIEAKLSIICVRNKVSFGDPEDGYKDPTTYNLGAHTDADDNVPSWVKAVLETAKTLK